MIVTHVIGIFSPEHGGPVVSLENCARAQVAAGWDVRIRTLEGYPGVGRAVRLTAPIDQRVFPIGWPAKLGRSRPLAAFLQRESDADVYHLHGAWLRAMFYGYQEAARRGRPYLVQINGSYQPFDLGRKAWRKRLVRWWYQDRILREAACLQVTSDQEAGEVRGLGFDNPIVVVPAGFDFAAMDHRCASIAAAPWPELAGRPFFLYLARIHPSKGIGLLLDAWKEIEGRHPETTLLIVGSGERGHVAEFRAKARRLGLERRCVWKGFASEDEKIWAYANARFYCLPSYTENFGNTVPEALGLGTPVLTTTATPWRALAAMDCGWITECEIAALTAGLVRALGTPVGRGREMGRLGRDYVRRNFSRAAVLEKQLRVYRWLLGGERPTDLIHAG